MENRGKCWRSSTHTCQPRWRNRAAATDPEGPAPMMATSVLVGKLDVFINNDSFRVQIQVSEMRAYTRKYI